MPVATIGDGGIHAAAAALRAGAPVVIPFPSPLPYAVVATTPAPVNEAKGRPRDQPLGILLQSDDATWIPALDLRPADLDFSLWVGSADKASLLLPLRPVLPAHLDRTWIPAAAHEGFLGITIAWRTDTASLGQEFGHLYVSSANRTTEPSAVTVSQAERMFGSGLLILDGDKDRSPSVRHGSASMVKIDRDGSAHLARHGINDRDYGSADEYLSDLRSRYQKISELRGEPGRA